MSGFENGLAANSLEPKTSLKKDDAETVPVEPQSVKVESPLCQTMQTVTRRGFIGSTAGALGIVALSESASLKVAAAGQADGAEPSQEPIGREKGVRVGMLTVPFGDRPLVEVLDFARKAGISCLEVVADPGSRHIDPTTFDAAKADQVKGMLAERKLEITGLACFMDACKPGGTERFQDHARKMVDAAVLLGVPTLCMQTGMPLPNLGRINQIKQVVPKVYVPIIAYAKEKGVKIAIENWFETCLQGIDTFECLLETIRDDNFGLNYDPSHLVHQQCNHLLPVKLFGKRIFHSHAKDTLVDVELRGRVGIYAQGWWRYVIPGSGSIHWGEYIHHLRMAGYSGVLSIEHEDSSLTREKGFVLAARHLAQFC
jgi:sugar phosphate isomerase/epimerase